MIDSGIERTVKEQHIIPLKCHCLGRNIHQHHGNACMLTSFLGLVAGKMVMVVMDAHTKWPKIITTGADTVTSLRFLFTRMCLHNNWSPTMA